MSASAFQHAISSITTPIGTRKIAQLESVGDISQLPYSIRVLLESTLRRLDGITVTDLDVQSVASYNALSVGEVEIPFMPGRVLLQDFTGVPAVVDLAAMRSAILRMTRDEAAAAQVNPGVPCDLVVDHSVQVDASGTPEALSINSRMEFERNSERYRFLKWGRSALDNFRVVPPATGIVHQVNLEYLAKVVWDDGEWLYPDSVVGTDSHTTMINGIGVLGWGVGGIEAEAAMLGQPISMLLPEVVGFELTGELTGTATATDLVLTVTEMLRKHGVVGKFVEFHGSGLANIPLANRATVANMAPEYGATVGYFPIDERTLEYLHLSGRPEELIEVVELYAKAQKLWYDPSTRPIYSSHLTLDLSTVSPSLSGPKRPQDRIDLSAMKKTWREQSSTVFGHSQQAEAPLPGQSRSLKDGDVVIAAVTSCTNTSNPEVMVGAGILARKARRLGVETKPWVKTSLSPGSKVVTEYLDASGLTDDLEALGFHNVGYGCMTCIGNSGPLPSEISAAIQNSDLIAAAVLSGNRNFEGRISPDVRANYLASPPLVVAYALAGTVDWDPETEPFPETNVYLRDVWPSREEIQDIVSSSVSRSQFLSRYADVFEGSDQWKAIPAPDTALYQWDPTSTYIQEPPYFQDMDSSVRPIEPVRDARVLVKVGDSVTTDHISPAGSIKTDSPAGTYLIEHGVKPEMFNSYGSRRGNDQIMTRGTFANIRVRNQLAPGTEGGFTLDHLDGRIKTIYEASLHYGEERIPLIVLAGKDYGMGSSRDWAAKGVFLLGVRAVIAESYERIHRSNLVMMGVLPLQYLEGESSSTLGLSGTERFEILVDDDLTPRQNLTVRATGDDGSSVEFSTICRVDTPIEVEYLRNGGILHYVLRKMATR